MPAVHLLIKGRVQGVYYRVSAKEMAERIGLTGWIRNTGDGDVEVMACGSPQQLEAFTEWCKKGPSRAMVLSVQVREIEDHNFKSFEIWR